MTAPTVYVRTLGHFDVLQAGRRIELARKKDKALVSYLCVNRGRLFTREYLAELLWERSEELRGRHSLNQAIYTIRRLLPEFLRIEGSSVGCSLENVTSDLDELSAKLRDEDVFGALDLLRGPFLSDLELLECMDFEHWRSNYNRQLFARLDVLTCSELTKLPRDAAEKIALKWPAYLLDLLPSAQTLEQLPSLPHPDRSQSTPVSPASARSFRDSSGPITPFVGRDRQLAELVAAWGRVKSGVPQFVTVTGLTGYGKTRLIEEFLAEPLLCNVRLMRCRCYESERRIALGPVADVLGRMLNSDDVEGMEEIWLAAIGQFFPSLHLNSHNPPELSATESKSRLHEAVLRLLLHISSRSPVVIFLDDVQWSDKSTRELMAYLSHHLTKGMVLIVVAHRVASSKAGIAVPWKEWQQIHVEELSAANVASMLDQLTADPQIQSSNVEHIRRLTGGHPYLLAEMVRCIVNGEASDIGTWQQTSVLANVDSFVGGLLRALPHQSQRVVAALAILARPAKVSLLRHVARVKRFHACIDLMLSRNLVTEGKGEISFRHDLIREIAYRRIPLFTRTELHKRAGDVLCRNSRRVGEAAEHYHKAQSRGLAYRYALLAVRSADARHATDEGISYLRLAISSCPRKSPSLRCRLAKRLYRAHRFSEAWHEVNYLLSRTTPPPARMLQLRLLNLELAYNSGKMSREALEDLITELKSVPTATRLLGAALRLKVRAAFNAGNKVAISDCIRELQDFYGRSSTSEGIEALTLAARLKSLIDSSVEAERWTLPVFAATNAIGDVELRIRIHTLIATVTYEVGKLEKAEEAHRNILRQIDSMGAITSWPLAASHTHMLLVEQGKYAAALDLESAIRKRARSQDAVHAYAVLCTNTAGMYYEMREFEKAKTALNEAMGYIATVGATFLQLELWGLKGLVAIECGEIATAANCARDGKEKLQRIGFRAADVSYLEILIARIDTLTNRRDEAVARLNEAIADYKERDVVCRLRMQLELANLLKKSGDSASARSHAKVVFHTATAINARPIAERADSLLHRL